MSGASYIDAMPLLGPSGFTSRSRLLFFAPHPDDESLAGSVLLQRAAAAGAAVRVVYLTDGDNNPWPQRVIEKRWRVRASDRRRWGDLRRAEAAAALRVLGLDEKAIEFLGWPDQTLTAMLLRRPAMPVEHLARIMHDWHPTDVVAPDVSDTHPDHSAVAVLVRLALFHSSRRDLRSRHWSYVVHGGKHLRPTAVCLPQANADAVRKRQAILCHRTQIRLSRRRFLGYAERPEQFVRVSSAPMLTGDGSIRSVTRRASDLEIEIRLPMKPKLGRATDGIFVLGRDRAGEIRTVVVRMPVRSGLTALETLDGKPVGRANFSGNAFAGTLLVPVAAFAREENLFVKFQRRSWFFDEAGWIQLPAAVKTGAIAAVPSESGVAVR